MITNSPYDTTAARRINMGAVLKFLRTFATNPSDYRSLDGYMDMRHRAHPLDVIMVVDSNEGIPPFSAPAPSEVVGKNIPYIFVDMRDLLRQDKRTGQWVTPRSEHYEFKVLWALCCWRWLREASEPRRLLSSSELPMKAFVSIFADRFARLFNLGPQQAVRLRIAAGIYWYCQHIPTGQEHADLDTACLMLQRILGVDAEDIRDVFLKEEMVQGTRSLTDFCACLETVCEATTRMAGMSPQVVYTQFSRLWFGPNSETALCMALEHPPTWNAVLYAASQEGGQMRSTLARTLKDLDRRDLIKQFQSSVVVEFGGHENLSELLTPPDLRASR